PMTEATSVTFPVTTTRVLADGRGDLSDPALAVDPAGRVVVAYIEDEVLVVLRAPLDRASPVERLVPAIPISGVDVSLAIGPDGEPAVAISDYGAIRLWRWDGAGWVAIGAVPDETVGYEPSLTFDALGRAVLAWTSVTKEAPYGQVVRAARYGDGWEDLGALHDESLYGAAPSVALFYSGDPVVAWLEGPTSPTPARLAYRTSDGWTGLSPPLGQWGRPILRMAGNTPFVAITGVDTAWVAKWANGGWEPLLGGTNDVEPRPGERSAAFDVDERGSPALARFARSGALTVSFETESGGVAWLVLPAVHAGRELREPAIALAVRDMPASPDQRYLHLAWIEDGGDAGDALLLDTLHR
ncbi:MAG TPA: hypothetical protein VD838_13340, partial [Anaeromyxobacteraceae bacterium]|nr:hypothetical protein [Anaeromyxobacteraceae bacterium]